MSRKSHLNAIAPAPARIMPAPERVAFTIHEFRNRYPISVTKLYELIGRGELRAVKVGGRTLIPAAAAENWFANLPALPRLVARQRA